MGEEIRNIFDALSLLNELEASEEDEAVKVKRAELNAYIKAILSEYAEKQVLVRILKTSEDPDQPSEIEVEFDDAVQFYEALQLHIGKTGFFIKGTTEFPMNALLKIKVVLKKEGVEFTVNGKVVWINPRPVKGKPAGIGVKLYKLDSIKRELLEDFKKGLVEPDLLSTLSEE